jgi:dTDP-4-amino-4,6-dideoxygalactose transaminase
MKIPLMDIQAQYLSVKNEIDEVVQRVMSDAIFVGGQEKELFEQEYSKALGVKHTLGVGNGTDAIFLVLKALGIGQGDEVVTAANSFIASSEAITATGARVVFCDVNENNSLMNLARLEELLEKRSASRGGKIKALLPVHLYGRILDMDALMALAEKYQVAVIEDAAQAHLARWKGRCAGTFGKAATFSFYPGKNLGAFGDAGAVTTNDTDLALKVKKLADHGRISKYDHDIEGFNSRLDTMQAAVLRVKLRHLEKWTQARQQKARIYDQLLQNLPEVKRPELPPTEQHVFHLYVTRVKNRDEVHKKLQSKNIFAGIHYPIALPFLKAYAYLQHSPQDFPVSFQLQNEILSLPLFPEMTEEAQTSVVQSLKECLIR